MYVLTNRGRNRPRKTTVVWKLLVQWEDKSESWTPLKYMKESHTVKVSEFSKERGIYDEPVFEWWFTYNPRKRDVIIYEVKHCIIKKTHKYSIKLSTTVEKAIEIDKNNGNHFWWESIEKEMLQVGIVFEILYEG